MATKWTVMVYLGADNNLSVDFLWNLKEMQELEDKVGPKKDVVVVAQYDPGQGIPTQRYVINRGSLQARADARKNKLPDSEDGWLILDDDKIPDLSEETKLKEIVDIELTKIVDNNGKLLGNLLDQFRTLLFQGNSPRGLEDCIKTLEGHKKLTDLDELKKTVFLGVEVKEKEHNNGFKEDFFKKYIETDEGRKELSAVLSAVRKTVFELRAGEEKENRFNEYRETLQGLKDPLNRNTGDPMTLLQFISWGIETYAADRYMVVLAGHGSGAVEDFLLKDETARDSLTLHELGDVFELVRKELTGERLLETNLKKESKETKRDKLRQQIKDLKEKGASTRYSRVG